MSHHHDEETKTLLPSEDELNVPKRVDSLRKIWMQKAVSAQTVYLICLFFLVLNVGLLAASWRAQGEIKSFFSMNRDIGSLPRPDPFAGLSKAAKSNPGVRPDY